MTPRTFGPYRLIERLAIGSASELWVCVEAARPQRLLVLKRLLPGADRDVARLLSLARERRHHTDQTYPTTPAGDSALIRNYRPGITLEAIRRANAMTSTLAVRWIAQIHDEVSRLAHQQPRRIFLDLHPRNVLITPEHTAELIDFGEARVEGALFRDPAGKLIRAHRSIDLAALETMGQRLHRAASDESTALAALSMMLDQERARRAHWLAAELV